MLRSALTFFWLCSLVSAETIKPSEGSKDDDCPLDGMSDFYGSGVRFGIYIVWLSSWLANNFLAEEIIGTLETNSIFLLALFTTVFYFSVKIEAIRVIDVIIILQLCMGFLFSVMSLWGYRTMYYKTEGPGGRRHFGGVGTHFRLLLMTMITAYNVWFWIEGIAGGLSNIDRRENCGGLVTFFIGPTMVKDRSTIGTQLTMAVLFVTYYGVMAIAAILGLSIYLIQILRDKKSTWDLIEGQDSEIALTKRELTHWYIAVSAFNLFWIIFSIICIESTLKLNHMQNVISLSGILSPGQLIPLLTGIFSFLRVFCVIFRNKMGQTCGEETKSSAEAIIDPPLRRATGSCRPRRRTLHRLLLAWLPWLGLFDYFHHSLKEIPFYSWVGLREATHGLNARYEKITPLKTQNSTVETKSPEAALLESTPQLQEDQTGLIGTSTKPSSEINNREASYSPSEPSPYDGGDYEDYGP